MKFYPLKYRSSILKKVLPFAALLMVLTGGTVNAQYSLSFTDTLNQTMEDKAAFYGLKGIAAAVKFPDGSVWKYAVGKYGTNDLQADMLFEMGSNTKTMVASIILMLEEENKLSIEDTLYKFISPVADVPYGITLKQMLNHTSGLFNYTNHPDFAPEINGDENKFWHPDTCLKYFMNPPSFPAGTDWEYSNTNYLLMGKVIEAVEGKPFHEVLRERIFDTQNLDHAYLAAYESYTEPRAGTWLTNNTYFSSPFVSFMSAAWSAGAVISTPEDLATWAFNLYRGDVLEDSSMAKMRDIVQLNPDGGYGLGVFEYNYKGKTYLGHGGTTLQNSAMDYSVSNDFSVVTVTIDQNAFNEPILIERAIIDIINFKLPFVVTGIEDHASAAAAFTAYPNPASDRIFIRPEGVNENAPYQLMVYNVSGQLIKEIDQAQNTVTLNKSDFGAGMFFVQMRTNEAISPSKLIVFQ